MKKIVIICLLLLIICLLFIIFNRTKDITSIKSLRLSYSTGYAINSSEVFEIKYEDKYYLYIKLDGISDEDKEVIEISNDEVNKVIEILNKYKVSKWNGFNKSNKNILDGNSFSLSIKGNIEVDAYGYMKYPNKYKEFKIELTDYLKGVK